METVSSQEMYSDLGAFVTSDHVPFQLLREHMMNLCSLTHPAKEGTHGRQDKPFLRTVDVVLC